MSNVWPIQTLETLAFFLTSANRARQKIGDDPLQSLRVYLDYVGAGKIWGGLCPE